MHRILLRKDFYKDGDMFLEPRFWAAFAQASAAYQLGAAVDVDSEADDFNEA